MPEHPLLNFFDQLKIDNTYELFFPKKEQGLVIIWLYEKIKNKTFPNGIFKEADIQQAFQEISLLSREKIERNPWDHYNSHIMALQEFFLIYNEEDQTYKLRDYAEHICKKIYTILSNRFNPTIIEITCMDLAAKLNSIGSPTDLQNWLDVHLDKSKFVLKEQIDFLQQQIDTTIQALRDKAKLKDCTLTDTLKQVEEDLDKIRQQNKELRGAFRETKKIKNGLLDHPFRDSSDETDEKTAEAIDYFEEIRVSLDMVDSRIDRLQPKIKQFFNALNRPLFNSRVSKFLNFLLNRSSIQNNQLVLPEPVHPFVTHIPTTTFTVIQRQTELFPVHTSQSNTYTEDPQKRDKAFNAERIKLKQQNLAGLWISRIRDQRKYRKDIHLSKSFFRILDENQEDIQLGLIVIYQLIKAFDKDENWRVEIHPDELVSMPGHSFVIHDIWLKQK